jgi:hypothetical protein
MERNIVTRKNDKRPIVCVTDFSAVASEAVDIAAVTARRRMERAAFVARRRGARYPHVIFGALLAGEANA